MKKSRDFLTSRDAAEKLGVSLTTVQLWVESGVLSAWKTVGGHRRIARNSVQDMLHKQLEATRAGPAGLSYKVVVVEDDPVQQLLYEMKFAEWDLPVDLITAENGFEGLLEIGRNKPDFVISDLDMPGMNGFEMIRAISKNGQIDNLRIVAVTGLGKSEIKAKGGLPAGIPILEKPIVFDELKTIFAKVYQAAAL